MATQMVERKEVNGLCFLNICACSVAVRAAISFLEGFAQWLCDYKYMQVAMSMLVLYN
jgi:hypothetical protein